jgi:hypothetical protein
MEVSLTEAPISQHRIDTRMVLRNLSLLESPTWQSHALDIGSDSALVAGLFDMLDPGRSPADQLSTVRLLLGDAYVTGFADAFVCGSPTQRSTRRYVQGMEDGNRVGRAVRRGGKQF